MSAVEDLSRRRGGREARRALRSRPLAMADAAVRPGMEGGQYKPLAERDMQRIHQTALKLLETVGRAQAIPFEDGYSTTALVKKIQLSTRS